MIAAMTTLLLIAAAYLLGSLPFAVISSRVFGLPDPRTYGSGNPGATNVLRSGKKAAAALTLLGDAAKGWLAVWGAQQLAPDYELGEPLIAAVALAALLGHLFSVFLGFKGGKGVATALGILLALDARLGLAALLAWLAVFALFRISSLAALAAALVAPIFAFYFFGVGPSAAVVLAMAALLVWRHKANIRKLLSGEETRFAKRDRAG